MINKEKQIEKILNRLISGGFGSFKIDMELDDNILIEMDKKLEEIELSRLKHILENAGFVCINIDYSEDETELDENNFIENWTEITLTPARS